MAERREWGSVGARGGASTRLDPDVLEAVAQRVAAGEGSRAKVVNDQLRRALGLVKQSQPEPARATNTPVSLGRPNGSRRGGSFGSARTSRPSSGERRCPPHPPGRIIGGTCAACGAEVRTGR